jgi:hypothetical protein
MKKSSIAIILFITFFLARAAICEAQTGRVAVQTGADVLEVKEKAFNFGKIPQGRPAVHYFDIVNTGPVDLRLENVQASCGCTTPEWSKEPIAPGATAKIKVGYNAYAEGPFTKTVTISYNNNQTKAITISGEVYKVPAGSAPENPSIQLLKQIN